MTGDDQERWDERYRNATLSSRDDPPAVPELFASVEALFPTSGAAVDVACGLGRTSVWLALRGLHVLGVDVSPVAIDRAKAYAARAGVAATCKFRVYDLDDGLPDGPPADLIVCHLFRSPGLDDQLIERLTPGGILAVACLSEVGHGPGRFRARAGELRKAFGKLDILASHEGGGHAWVVARG